MKIFLMTLQRKNLKDQKKIKRQNHQKTQQKEKLKENQPKMAPKIIKEESIENLIKKILEIQEIMTIKIPSKMIQKIH